MKIIAADIVLLIVGLLLFASAGTALYMRGDLSTAATSPIGVYNVAVTTSDARVGQQNVGSMASGQVRFDVTHGNVTVVVVEVACTDNAGGGAAGTFSYQVAVTGPNNTRGNANSRPCAQTARIEVPVSAAPSATTVQGEDRDAAMGSLSSPQNATKAQGAWNVQISGSRSTPVPGLPTTPPTGTVTLSLTQWQATLSPVVR